MKIPKYRVFILVAFIGATLFFVFQMGFSGRESPQAGRLRGDSSSSTPSSSSSGTIISKKRTRSRPPTGRCADWSTVSTRCPPYLDGGLARKYKSMKDLNFQTGLVLYKRYGSFPLVVGTIEKSPAVASKVQPGDVISAIDGQERPGHEPDRGRAPSRVHE